MHESQAKVKLDLFDAGGGGETSQVNLSNADQLKDAWLLEAEPKLFPAH